MRKVYLFRQSESIFGTFGVLTTDGFSCYTLELQWKNNQNNISCIPTGEYLVKMRKRPNGQYAYWLTNVPNRQYVLIHSGNFAGDRSMGLKCDVHGCILLGSKIGYIEGQKGLLLSRIAIDKFVKIMKNEEFTLKIERNQNE